jgi:hypothetical protein
MTVFTDWQVFLGGFDGSNTVAANGVPADSVDFTSRMRGFTADFTISLGDIGTGTVTVELDNSDGALTPGGGGTYGSLDWFAQPLFLVPSAGLSDPPAGVNQGAAYPFNTPTFSGQVGDFRYTDDGFASTVTIIAYDWLTLVGRLSFQSSYTRTSVATDDAIHQSINLGQLPTFGADATSKSFFHPAAAEWTTVSLSEAAGTFIGDVTDTLILTDGGFLYPPWFLALEAVGLAWVYYFYEGVPRNLLAPDPAYSFEAQTFKDVGNIGTTELPFNRLQLGFTTDELVTQAEVGRSGGTTQFSFNDTGSQTYGPRSIQLIELMMDTDADALAMAQYYTERFNSTEFTVSSFEITSGMIQQYANDAALDLVKQLMSRSGPGTGPLYKPTTVSWTYRDSSTATKVVVPMRQQISATPDRWTMTFDCLPASANMGFTLDDTRLGVLNQNRIT